MALTKPHFYNAWFCPFAQRAWLGLLHRGIEFDYFEQDPYDKSPEWLAINPRGLVPTIIHNGKSVYESVVLLEYLDEAWPDHPGPKVMPQGAYARFTARAWADHVTKKIVPQYYYCLQKKSEEERSAAKNAILNSLKLMFDNMESEGPFYLGKQPCYVDFILFPFAFRIDQILSHFRNFVIPKDGYEKYHIWFENMLALDCVKGTLADKAKLIGSYQRYADDTAKTEVATAVRAGTVLP